MFYCNGTSRFSHKCVIFYLQSYNGRKRNFFFAETSCIWSSENSSNIKYPALCAPDSDFACLHSFARCSCCDAFALSSLLFAAALWPDLLIFFEALFPSFFSVIFRLIIALMSIDVIQMTACNNNANDTTFFVCNFTRRSQLFHRVFFHDRAQFA